MTEKDNPIPEEFYQLVDEFILQANQLNEQWPRSRISAALMYAAARYNAHNWVYREVDLEQTAEQATDWYMNQYRGMFQDNVQQLEAARNEHERDNGA